jgi:hypothetical protein
MTGRLDHGNQEFSAAHWLCVAAGQRFAHDDSRRLSAMYYTQIRTNALAGYLVNGLDGLTPTRRSRDKPDSRLLHFCTRER